MDEEAIKPCIQDRFRSFFVHARVEDIFTYIIMLLILALGILAYVPPDKLITNPIFKTRTELFLTSVIGMFALLEGYSTALQLYDNRKRNKIVDLSNELEKVYGPLFTLLSTYKKIVDYTDEQLMTGDRMSAVDDIFSIYPHILSKKLYNFWKDKIHNEEPVFIGREVSFWVPIEFVDDFLAEYEIKVKNYRKILDKK